MSQKFRILSTAATIVPLSLALLCNTAVAQDAVKKGDFVDENIDTSIKAAEEAKKSGWKPTLSVGASFNLIDNRNVIGQAEGSTFTAGANLNGGLDYTSKLHNVDINLTINETFTQTPTIAEFVNTNDLLQLDAAYYFKIPSLDWVGPFARGEARTSIFPGYDVRGQATTYAVTDTEGNVANQVGDGDGQDDRFRLRDPFAPLFLKESVGAYARPVAEDSIKLEIRLGAGARQVFAAGQYAVTDATTDPVQVKELIDYQQIGAEAAVTASGAFQKNRITYSASLQALTPFFNSVSTDDRGPVELTELEFDGKVSLKIVEWASLDYQLRVLRQPLLLDEFQIQNNLLLTFGYTLLGE